MSSFVEKADYGQAIRDGVLDDVTEAEDGLLDVTEKRAIDLAAGYLKVRYDTDAIFAATGDDRHDQLLGVIIDLSLYYLHKRLNPRKIPAHRKDSYEEAMNWLMMVRDGDLLPDLPVPAEEDQEDIVLFQSNPKRENHI
jgi:hypothetical protein